MRSRVQVSGTRGPDSDGDGGMAWIRSSANSRALEGSLAVRMKIFATETW